MNVFEYSDAFPEISEVKFIPVSKVKPLKGETIHIGTRKPCSKITNLTSNEREIFYGLLDKLETSSFDELDFLSFNDLKKRQTEFCQSCLEGAAYREEENYLGRLDSLINFFSLIEEFTKTDVTNDFTFFMNILSVAVAYENNITFMYGQHEKAKEIINFFKGKFDLKLKEIKHSLFTDEAFEKLKIENLERASLHIFNSAFMEPSMKTWFENQKSIFEQKLLTTKAKALFNGLNSLTSLEFFIRIPLEEKDINEEEVLFLIKTSIMYLTEEADFNLMPHLLFLARESILKKVDFSQDTSFIIVEDNVDEKVLETCRSLFDEQNSTFDTCEKVYNIAINI